MIYIKSKKDGKDQETLQVPHLTLSNSYYTKYKLFKKACQLVKWVVIYWLTLKAASKEIDEFIKWHAHLRWRRARCGILMWWHHMTKHTGSFFYKKGYLMLSGISFKKRKGTWSAHASWFHIFEKNAPDRKIMWNIPDTPKIGNILSQAVLHLLWHAKKDSDQTCTLAQGNQCIFLPRCIIRALLLYWTHFYLFRFFSGAN